MHDKCYDESYICFYNILNVIYGHRNYTSYILHHLLQSSLFITFKKLWIIKVSEMLILSICVVYIPIHAVFPRSIQTE